LALDRRYADALEELADAAEKAGAPGAAVDRWRRRAAHDPYNGRVALHLMQALDASGDRAGALRHARDHAVLLREELNAEPDAQVAEFAERLRREPPAVSKAALAEPRALLPAMTASAAPMTGPEPASPGPDPGSSAPRSRSMPRRGPVMIAVALTLALVLAFVVGYGDGNADADDIRSVGVLPFVNLSADSANTYFSDGLSEQIILALGRIDGLRVAARTSSFALRNRNLDVRAIGDTLDVRAVLDGSVLVDGGRLRVIAQLSDARTGYHMWSDQYDGDLGGAFVLQDRIAAAIATALDLHFSGDTTPLASRRPPSLEAYDLYLRGLYLRNGLSADGLRQAVAYFDRVIELEPGFAQALAAKASVIAPQAYFRYAGRDSVVTQLRTLTARALELDPGMGEAYVALGVLKLFYDWDWSGAKAALIRATELNPNDAHAWHHLANYYSATGSGHDPIAARERAVQLDPLNARSRILLSHDLFLSGDDDGALAQARRAAQLDPLNPLLLGRGPGLPRGAAEVLLRQGHTDEALAEYVRVATLRDATTAELEGLRAGYAAAGWPGFWRAWLAMDLRQSGASPDPNRMALMHLLAGDTTSALVWLERAFDERNPGLVYLQRDTVLSGLRAHPRVARITRAMKFPASP
jgi:TolB-like protein